MSGEFGHKDEDEHLKLVNIITNPVKSFGEWE